MSTRAMVLGLLQMNGPMSGYEIQMLMQSAKTDLWANVAPASIYHALKKLQQEGKVILKTMEQTGLRSKAIFSITTDGEQELRDLLQASFSKSSVAFPTDLYTALTFIDQLAPSEVEFALDQQEKEIKKLHETLQEGYQEKKHHLQEKVPGNVTAIFNNLYAQCELQMKFVQQMRKLLKEGK
ncbi:PadR family transcriptional regulator [Brevibacillus daliensis]|uniref:PadR family transcriptional regulator n=1 Tax=Brevibacillus daliensis TaxID=2892995 RepID=UPI001E5D05F4|nr:PadR family transcriptional regulator [Brevibacillus daliensis]